MLEEVTPDRLIALHDRIVDVLLDTFRIDVFTLSQPWLEQNFRAAETLFAQDDLLTVGEHIGTFAGLGLGSFLQRLVKVLNDVGHRLFHDL